MPSSRSIFLILGLSIVGLQHGPAKAIRLLDRLEASVNGKVILRSDVSDFRKAMGLRSKLDPLFSKSAIGQKGEKASDAEIIQFLIDEKLMASLFPISDGEVEKQIDQIQRTNKITKERLTQEIESEGFEFDDYIEIIRSSMSKQALIERDIAPKTGVSDDDVRNFYVNQNPGKGETLSKSYHVFVLRVQTSNYRTSELAKARAEELRKEIVSGSTFEEVVKKSGEDSLSQESGGDLGVVPEEQLSPGIRSEIKKLQKGDLSSVFALGSPPSHYLVVKYTDTKIGTSERFEKVKDEIRTQLISAEYQRQLTLWFERQRSSAVIHQVKSPE